MSPAAECQIAATYDRLTELDDRFSELESDRDDVDPDSDEYSRISDRIRDVECEMDFIYKRQKLIMQWDAMGLLVPEGL